MIFRRDEATRLELAAMSVPQSLPSAVRKPRMPTWITEVSCSITSTGPQVLVPRGDEGHNGEGRYSCPCRASVMTPTSWQRDVRIMSTRC